MGPYNMTAYLATMGISAVFVSVLFYFLLRKSPDIRSGKAFSLSVCTLLLGMVFGILFAKLFYFLFNFFYVIEQDAGAFLLSLKTEELSYYGGIAGVCLAVVLSAKIFGLKPGKILNTFAPAGALMAAAARFAEYFLYPTGTGISLENPLPFPLAINIVWSEDYTESVLAVCFFEGIISLAAFALCLKHRDEPRRMLRTLFYLCLPQVLLESLRADAIRLLFVKMEQLLWKACLSGMAGKAAGDILPPGFPLWPASLSVVLQLQKSFYWMKNCVRSVILFPNGFPICSWQQGWLCSLSWNTGETAGFTH